MSAAKQRNRRRANCLRDVIGTAKERHVTWGDQCLWTNLYCNTIYSYHQFMGTLSYASTLGNKNRATLVLAHADLVQPPWLCLLLGPPCVAYPCGISKSFLSSSVSRMTGHLGSCFYPLLGSRVCMPDTVKETLSKSPGHHLMVPLLEIRKDKGTWPLWSSTALCA